MGLNLSIAVPLENGEYLSEDNMFEVQIFWRWLRKNIHTRDILILSLLFFGYSLTRLINLDKFPIFTDEGIYIRWAQVAWKDATFRFISLTDGRQPLQTWGTIPFLKLFPTNMLFGGRLFSVVSGLGTLVGLLTTMWYLFGKRAAYYTGFLYVITPYFLFYDRMALVDSAVTAAVVWMFFFSILLARTLRLDIAMILGFITGFALLGKSSMRLYAALVVLGSFLVIYPSEISKVGEFFSRLKGAFFGKTHKVAQLVNFFILYGVVIAIALLIYNVQRLSPYLHFVEQKNTTFVLTLPELLAHPFSQFSSNIINIPYYIFAEMGYVVAIIGVIGFFFMYKKDRTITLYLLSWITIVVLMLSFVARVLFPRYVMPLGALLIMPAGYFISEIHNKKYFIGILSAIFLSVFYFHYTIIFDPAKIPFPQIDRGQYIEDWPAGWGIKEIVDMAREKTKDKPVYLLTEGDFGMAGDTLRSHIRFGEEIHVKAYWPLSVANLEENQALLEDNYVYVVYSHCKEKTYTGGIIRDESCWEFEDTRPVQLIKKYPKPGGNAAIYLFQLKPASENRVK